MNVTIFKGGILHVLVDVYNPTLSKPDPQRFRISDFDGVEWDQLQVDDQLQVNKISNGLQLIYDNTIGDLTLSKKKDPQPESDQLELQIQYKPFRMHYKINGENVLEINNKDLLYFENTRMEDYNEHSFKSQINQEEESDLLDQFVETLNKDYRKYIFNTEKSHDPLYYDFRESLALSFRMHSPYLYGLPERADQVLLEATDGSGPYRLYNLDIFKHRAYSKQNLYSSVPYITAHSYKYDVSVLWMNSAETFVEILKDKESHLDEQDESEQKDRLVTWLSESGKMEFFVFGTSVQSKNPQRGPKYITKILADITGYAHLPPYYSLGFHYSKWESLSTERLFEIYRQFAEYDLPVDMFWLDIDYTTENKYFEFDAERFKDLDQYVELIKANQKRLVVITDPHIKVDPTFFVYREGLTHEVVKDEEGFSQFGVFVRNNDNTGMYVGDCWPKESVWVDYLNSNAVQYWKGLYKYEKFKGTSNVFNFWIDMNEPSVFSGDELTMDKRSLHLTDKGILFEHKDVHNAYGLLMAKATFQGIQEREAKSIEQDNDEYESKKLRPFMLSRAVFPGSQKYGAMWTGDNQASYDFLSLSIQMCLSMAISGFPFCGADVGGFTGQGHPDLLVKWYQAAVFQPFFRAHAHNSVNHREPFLLPEAAYNVVRLYVLFRQSLIPYIYTYFYLNTLTGTPLMRPMWMEYPQDERTYRLDNQYLFGDSLLVCPNTGPEQQIEVYLPPSDSWYFFINYELQKKSEKVEHFYLEKDEIGVFIKAGSILPRKFLKRLSSLQTLKDPFILEIFLSPRNNQAKGLLYLDDGETYGYQREKEYTLVEFVFNEYMELELKYINKNFLNGRGISIAKITIVGIKEKIREIQVRDTDDEWQSLKSSQYIYKKNIQQLNIKDINIMFLQYEQDSTVLKIKLEGQNNEREEL